MYESWKENKLLCVLCHLQLNDSLKCCTYIYICTYLLVNFGLPSLLIMYLKHLSALRLLCVSAVDSAEIRRIDCHVKLRGIEHL